MQAKLHIKKGDSVKVIAGNANGQEGVVLSVDKAKQRAIIEGVNLVSKHTKPSAQQPQGGIIKKESPIHVSNLQLTKQTTGKTKAKSKK